jgi:hypothetical protein
MGEIEANNAKTELPHLPKQIIAGIGGDVKTINSRHRALHPGEARSLEAYFTEYAIKALESSSIMC